MTHVAHPYLQRLGIIRDWKSRWFAANPARFREYVRTDAAVRTLLARKLKGMFIADVSLERNQKELRITIKTARPGLVIGRNGEGAAALRAAVHGLMRTLKLSETPDIKIDIEEIRTPESNARVVAQMVVEGLEKRMPFRRVMKQTAEKVMANRDVKGVRIAAAGRLGGADMSRKEEIKRGRIPLQTLRADIDFARERAVLPYGTLGVKVWVYRGDVFARRGQATATDAAA